MNPQMLSFLRENAFFIAVLLILFAGFVLLRTKGTDVGTTSEFDALIGAGQPVIVEIFSNT
ncbi:MAG: hypothetical protein ISS56_02410 [Anaerolineae bacterium]|jgi:hypothetical protein|nr:hypothetical protein [Anaerolineae bacterium]